MYIYYTDAIMIQVIKQPCKDIQ